MIDELFLLYFADPYSVGRSQFAIASKLEMTFVRGDDLSRYSNLISYDVPTLIDDLRRSDWTPPTNLTDVSDAIRLCAGTSRADGGEKHWSLWSHLRRHFDNESNWRLCRDLHEARAIPPSGQRLGELLGSFANAITALWQHTRLELEKRGELVRFDTIERPVSTIFHARQYDGIPIRSAVLSNFISAASSQKYKSYQDVAQRLNVSPTGMSYWNVGQYLNRTDFANITDDVTGYTLRDQMRLASAGSGFAAAFSEYSDAVRDVDILTRLADSAGRVFPTIQSIGTITSRILLSDPYLQELRRRFRGAIGSEAGHVLIYFDYSQFEPGIMASLSGDSKLIELYNQGDVYSALSIDLFGDATQRQICKRAFLGFSYGMSARNIAALMAANAGEGTASAIEQKILAFFDRFKVLTEFKVKLERKLEEDGCISTLLGNHRRRTSVGPLTPKE